jgi:hypothetical protein
MKRWIAISLVGLGALVVGLLLGGVLYNQWLQENPGDLALPGQLANLQQATSTHGGAAVQEIKRLHNQEFAISRGATASYGTDQKIRLWVGGTLFPFQAQDVLEAMRSGIESGRFPFTQLGEMELSDTTVFALESANQLHLYFRQGPYVIWLAANPDVAEQAVAEILEFYR